MMIDQETMHGMMIVIAMIVDVIEIEVIAIGRGIGEIEAGIGIKIEIIGTGKEIIGIEEGIETKEDDPEIGTTEGRVIGIIIIGHATGITGEIGVEQMTETGTGIIK